MAGVSDSEDSNRDLSKSKTQADAVTGDPESEEENGSDEPEYEIEEVLDAKRGYFPEGRMGYFVKWKGYGPSENSWVDEADAVNAKALVQEFWRKNPQKKKTGSAVGRKSVDKKSPKKASKSAAAADDASETGDTSTKKRGRKSVSRKVDSGDEMDVDESDNKPAKKARTTQSAKTNSKKNKTDSPEVADRKVGDMKEYMGLPGWEGLVKSVDTVERADDKLLVFFTLHTGEAIVEASDICKERFPQKLLDFYESNLRWRTVEGEE